MTYTAPSKFHSAIFSMIAIICFSRSKRKRIISFVGSSQNFVGKW